MIDDPQITEVLRYADEVAPDTPRWAGSAEGVARIARRRRAQRRRATAAASGVGVVGLIALVVWWPTSPSPPDRAVAQTPLVSPADEAAAAATVAEFDRQAAVLRRALAQDPAAHTTSLADPLGAVSFDFHSAQTAGLLLFEAEQLAKQSDQIEQARRRYERVIKLFPRSRWALNAKQQLEQLEQLDRQPPGDPAFDGQRRQGAYL